MTEIYVMIAGLFACSILLCILIKACREPAPKLDQPNHDTIECTCHDTGGASAQDYEVIVPGDGVVVTQHVYSTEYFN